MNSIELLCFDIGGTLIDCGPGFARMIQRCVSRPVLRSEWDRYINLCDGMVGDDLAQLAEGLDIAAEEASAAFHESANYRRRLFDDVIPALRHLAPLRCVALSNAARWATGDGLLGAERFIERVFYSYAIGYSKPSREAFDHVAAAVNVAPSRILMIGDSLDYDCRGAMAAGWKALLLNRGDVVAPEHPFASISTLAALPVLLAADPAAEMDGR